jgi:uncharacterized SAM-binding protein YcdF (DUF218 family)
MLTLLLSPATLLFAGLLLLAWWLRRSRQRALFVFATGICLAYYVAAAPATGTVFGRIWATATDMVCEQPPAGATVVILTGGATGSARSASEVWRLDQETSRRIAYGLDLAARAPGAEVLVSGGAEVGLTNEARISEQLVLRMGWPAGRLRIEDTSRDTYTSARDVAPMLRPGAPLVLVTSSLHMRRAAYAYRKAGMRPLACGVPELDALILPDSLIPSAGSFARSSQALKEVLGLIVYSLRKAPVHAGR